MRKIELLSPAGGPDVLKACISAGADAVYMGLDKFSARAYADNPDIPTYLKALDYAHLRGVRLYCTVNTLFKEDELERELIPALRLLYQAGLDAVIVQDLGVMKRIHDAFPLLPVHVSTQAAVTGPRTADFLKRYHVTRIVPARELSLSEIRILAEKTGMEIECFVHGALCYSYSGLCLFSSLAAGRSGNRGRCGQPCRLPYKLLNEDGVQISKEEEPYLLSLKDLNALRLLPKLLSAGVTSFKIEGRMKKAEYAAGVTAIYGKYLDKLLADPDAPYSVSKEDEGHLFYLFNRQGFSEGYYERENGRDMIAIKEREFRKEEASFLHEIRERFIRREKKVPVRMFYEIRKDSPMRLSCSALNDGEEIVSVAEGAVPDPAMTRALTDGELKKQLSKTGETDFVLTEIEGELDGGLFVSLGSLNELRRAGLNALKEKILQKYRRSI